MKPVTITTLSVLASIVLVGGTLYFSRNSFVETPTTPGANIVAEGGKQIIDITAKGGYSPRKTVAKANVPTVLRIKTDSTFDCSSALKVPVAGYSGNLPPEGETLIEIPIQQPGAQVKGICSMGMYSFTVSFS